MPAYSDHKFIQDINQNLGIAHKVCHVYFSGSDEREDVLQEMMYQLWRSYPSFQGQSKFSTWMYRVCLNTALTYLRKAKKHKHATISLEHHQIPDIATGELDEQIKLLFEAIGILSPVNKAIVLLYLEDISYEEIAHITGLSKSNVSVRLVRIKKVLEQQMRKQLNLTEDANT
jgi:RNA polymerase sigma-70 factor (ECF subfamily)